MKDYINCVGLVFVLGEFRSFDFCGILFAAGIFKLGDDGGKVTGRSHDTIYDTILVAFIRALILACV